MDTKQSPREPLAFRDMGTARRSWEAVGGPLVAGAVAGLALAVSTWAYVAAVVVVILSSLPVGPQHRTWRGAWLRSGLGGVLFAVAVLVVNALTDSAAMELPQPEALWVLSCIVPSMTVTSITFALSQRRRRIRTS